MSIEHRFSLLKDTLDEIGLDGLIVPYSDEHLGEYVVPSSQFLSWLTGFSSSAGVLFVIQSKGYFFLDSRYLLQARKHPCSRELEIVNMQEFPPEQWLRQNVPQSLKIGIDPWHISAEEYDRFANALAVSGSSLVSVGKNPVAEIWDERPAPPSSAATNYPLQYAGESAASKISRVAADICRFGAQATIITALDDLAWLFNIRGDDIPYNMLVKGYGIVHGNGTAELFLDPEKITEPLTEGLESAITLRHTECFEDAIITLGQKGKALLIDSQACPAKIVQLITSSGGHVVKQPSSVGTFRAVRNTVEAEGARKAQIIDCAALARAICWIKRAVPAGEVTEFDISQKLVEFRSDTSPELFKKLCFESIVSAGPNGPLGHYRPTRENCRTVEKKDFLLIDSGGHYLGATTDITRTLAFAEPGDDEKQKYSLVLKGLMALSEAVFPYGTCGLQLDTLAKYPLWQNGSTYVHGTGHGIGSYLGVHEGPHRISADIETSRAVIEPGMMFANEPSFRIQGEYCIRLENDLLTMENSEPTFHSGNRWLKFETLTFLPFERLFLDPKYYEPWEREWINSYHKKTFQLLAPILAGKDQAALDWLEENTREF